MPRFKKRPVAIEADQWVPGKDVPGVYGCNGQPMCPCYRIGGNHDRPHVMTAHGQIVHLSPGDWIIPEPDGRGHYPCKDDIFRSMYQPVDDAGNALEWGTEATPLGEERPDDQVREDRRCPSTP